MNVNSTIQWAPPYSVGLLLGFASLRCWAGSVLFAVKMGRRGGRSRWPVRPAASGAVAEWRSCSDRLALIIINPVRIDETPGIVERPKLFYLLDTSQSMAIGKGTLHPVGPGCANDSRRRPSSRPASRRPRSAYSDLATAWPTVNSEFWRFPRGPHHGPAGRTPGAVLAAEPARTGEPAPAPTDSDTLLCLT